MTHSLARLFLCLALAPILPACGGGGGGQPANEDSDTPAPPPQGYLIQEEAEPNDDPANATALTQNRAGVGVVSGGGDRDEWWFEANEGDLVRIEIFTNRWMPALWQTLPGPLRADLYTVQDGDYMPLDFGAVSHPDLPGWSGMEAGDRDFATIRIAHSGRQQLRLSLPGDATHDAPYCVFFTRLPAAPSVLLENETGTENDTIATATPVASYLTRIEGMIEPRTVDFYALPELTSRAHVTWHLTTRGNGTSRAASSYGLATLTVVDEEGSDVSIHPPYSARLTQQTILSRILEPGRYYLRVNSEVSTDLDLPPAPARYTIEQDVTLATVTHDETVTMDDASSALAPMQIDFGERVFGTVDQEDRSDVYRIPAEAGDVIFIESWAPLVGTDFPAQAYPRTWFESEDGAHFVSPSSTSRFRSFLAVGRGSVVIAVSTSHLLTAGPLEPYAFVVRRVRGTKAESEGIPNRTTGETRNDTALTAETIEGQGWCSGAVMEGQPDVWSFRARGNSIRILSLLGGDAEWITSNRLMDYPGQVTTGMPGAPFEPSELVLVVEDSRGNEVQRVSTGTFRLWRARGSARRASGIQCAVRLPTDGTYYVRVLAIDTDSDANTPYVLHLQ